MRIVHTENSCGWGGQEIRILAEAQGMMARGHELHLLCPPEARIFAEAQAQGIPVTPLPMARKNLRGFLAVRRWLASHPADVINTHSSTDSWLTALACATLTNAPPIVRTRHVSAPVSGNWPTRWLYHRARRIVTTGVSLRQHLLDVIGGAPERILSIPTGIDTERFVPADATLKRARREALGLPADVFLFGIVATLRSWKGHADLLDAVAGLEGNWRLLIVGDGPQRENLLARIADLKLGERVLMPGNQTDVLPWLQTLDAFALPSYANEGVPQALMQAMLTGLPAVTTNIGGIPEVALEDDTALVVPPRDVQQLATALQRLMADTELRRRLGAAARHRVAENFSYNAMLDRMEAVFKAAADRSAG
jgi:glycosyltransferase involved in cell wall biosynthesis